MVAAMVQIGGRVKLGATKTEPMMAQRRLHGYWVLNDSLDVLHPRSGYFFKESKAREWRLWGKIMCTIMRIREIAHAIRLLV